jgi:hypothetical protein
MDGDGGILVFFESEQRACDFQNLEVWYSLSGVKCKEGIESVEEWCDYLKSWVVICCFGRCWQL